MRDEKDGADGPRVEVVVQNKKIRCSVFQNSALHFGVSGVDNSGAKRLRLAFQLEWRFARGAEVVNSNGVARRNVKPWRFAGGTEKVRSAPGFRADAGALRCAFVVVEVVRRKFEIHDEIRSCNSEQKIPSLWQRAPVYLSGKEPCILFLMLVDVGQLFDS
jgi:hypothetical protein